MIAFLIGLLMVALFGAVSILGFFLFPLLLLLGTFARFFLGIFLVIFTIWLIGKVTLLMIENIRSRSNRS